MENKLLLHQLLAFEQDEVNRSKKVLEEGTKVVKSAPKTIAKNVIRREYLKQGLIRNFIVNEIGAVVTRGEEIELS